MIQKYFLSVALMFVILISKAQTPMQIDGLDCNGTSHDMFSELDAGKAVVVFFFMNNCSSCPPVAKKVQAMVNNILVDHPDMVKGYVMPFNNTTTCTATANWVVNNSLSFYAPYDSGSIQVAHYGGFGMPTVVLLGGKAPNQRVLFSTLSFATSDTTIMRDSILALLSTTAIHDIPATVNSINLFPNPSVDNVNIEIDLNEQSNVAIDIVDITGKKVSHLYDNTKATGLIQQPYYTTQLSNGLYLVQFTVNGKTVTRKLNVTH